MTQSVAGKTPIPDKIWRRHTDPRGLWIGVATGSVALHLLLCWLMRSSELSLLSQQQSSADIPIEFVETSPKAQAKARPQSKAKPVSPSSFTTRTGATSLPKRVTQEHFKALPAPSTEDRNTIAFANNKKASTSQRSGNFPKRFLKTPTVRQKIASSELKPTKKLKLTPKLVTTPSPNIPDNIQPTPIPQPQTPENRNSPTPFHTNTNIGKPHQFLQTRSNTTHSTDTTRRRDSSPLTGEQQSLPLDPVNNGEQIGDAPRTHTGETPRTEIHKAQPNPRETPRTEIHKARLTLRETPRLPTKKVQTPAGGGLVATWSVEAYGVQKDRLEKPAQPIGSSREQNLNSLSINREFNNQPIEFQASLIIDNTGKLVEVYIPPNIPQRTQYREYALSVFKDQKFIPATSSNGEKPPVSNLVVHIRIQPKFQ